MGKSNRTCLAASALLCLAAACVLLLLCSQSSPLYPTNTWVDANCLLTVGRSMKGGAVLYRDIYEQKGPTLYLIHLFAAWISDTSFFGVFVMEVISFASVLFMGAMLLGRRLRLRAALSWAVMIGAFVLTSSAFMKGDSAEEFCLPYLMGAVLTVFGGYGANKGPMDKGRLFVCGLLAGIVATIKFTVLGLFVGLCLAEGIFALSEGGIKRAFASAGVFLAGMLTPVFLWCVYFAAHGALKDFYTAYVHNNIFLYGDETRTVMHILRDVLSAGKGNILWAAAALIGFAALLLDRREPVQLRFAAGSMAVLAFASVFLIGRTFAYYPLALAVFAFAGMYSLSGYVNSVKLPDRAGVIACASLCLLALLTALVISPNAPLRGMKKEKLAQARLAGYIHSGATVLQYSHLDDGIYLFTDTLPAERFFCRLNVDYPLMQEELDRYLEEAVTDYVLVSWEELPERFDRYQWVATDAGYDDENRINKLLHLYRRKE